MPKVAQLESGTVSTVGAAALHWEGKDIGSQRSREAGVRPLRVQAGRGPAEGRGREVTPCHNFPHG